MMSGFTDNLKAEWLHDAQEWRLTEELVYVDVDGSVHRVPAGFLTDFSSIPRPLRGFAFSAPRSRPAGALHDYGYRVLRGNRKEHDLRFYRALRSLGVNTVSANVYYFAVRSCGWWAWWKKRKGAQR